MLESLIDSWLYFSCGSYEDFWNSTFREIAAIITNKQKFAQDEISSRNLLNYHLAVNIVSFFSMSMNGAKIPEYNELYPEIEINTAPKNPEFEALKIKEQLKQFTKNFNSRTGKDGLWT